MPSPLRTRWLAALLLSCSLMPAARAALVVADSGFGPATTVFNQNGPGNVDQVVGWTFTVGSNDLRVTALGEWDVNAARGLGGGLASSILVGLWDNSDGSLLASLFVPTGTAGTTLIDDFRFVDLATPVLLQSGHSYTVGDRRFPFGGTQTQFDLQGVGNTPTGSTDVIFGLNVNTPTGFDINTTPLAAQRPTQNIGGVAYRWLGPNIEYTVVPTIDVPEPGSLALAVLGFALLASSRGRLRPGAAGAASH